MSLLGASSRPPFTELEDEEIPENTINVRDSEITAEKYISAAEKERLRLAEEERKRLEAERAKDNMEERALQVTVPSWGALCTFS